MRKKIGGIVVIGLLIIFTSSCKKYEEGGLISKAEKRLTSTTWKLKKYIRNGNDETSALLITNYTEVYNDNGSLKRSFIDADNENESQSGTWTLIDDNANLKIDGVGSIEMTSQSGTVSSSEYVILRLVKDEFWYSFDNGGDTHEFRLVAN